MSNSDKANPGVEIVLDGVAHTLIFTLQSFIELDQLTGKNPLGRELWENIRPSDLATLVWSGLLHEEPRMSISQIASKIGIGEIKTLPVLIQKAFDQATPTENEDEKKSIAEELIVTGETT